MPRDHDGDPQHDQNLDPARALLQDPLAYPHGKAACNNKNHLVNEGRLLFAHDAPNMNDADLEQVSQPASSPLCASPAGTHDDKRLETAPLDSL